ncbi:MAG: helix-turn-helix transcriptional regulator [Clostridia bacterium]|nr:helix-turn-helix transcriptional regulator [Clostridia bacterium]
MNVDYKLIGERIKEQRVKAKLTQEALAERLDVSIGYVSQVERGITKISLDLLGKISSILNIDMGYFVSGSATNCNNYLFGELGALTSNLSNTQRKMLVEIIEVIGKY